MCNPLLFTVGATLLSGAMSAKAEGEAGADAERAAKQNALIADAQAEQARQIGNIEETKVLRKMRQTLGAQRAGIAAANVDPSSGSALDLQLETAQLGSEEATITRANAMRQAWGFDIESQQQRELADVTRRTTRNKQRQTLLTSASRAYSQYYGTG